jgi:hypothetical protein
MNNIGKITKEMAKSIATIAVLVILLTITTYALVTSAVSITENEYGTGFVKINLNDDVPIIQEYQFNWRPNETMEKDFFIENTGTDEVYYRIYFDEVEGEMAKVMQVKIMDSEELLYSGTAETLTRTNVSVIDEPLKVGERKTLTAYFICPEDDSAEYVEDLTMSFNLCADAVQVKNNGDKLFE